MIAAVEAIQDSVKNKTSNVMLYNEQNNHQWQYGCKNQ